MTDRKAFELFLATAIDHDFLGTPITRLSVIEAGPMPSIVLAWIEKAWHLSRKQALLESIDACKTVADQLVVGTSEQYEVGREMGATICKNTIEELLK